LSILTLEKPAVLKRQYGQRALKVEIQTNDGGTLTREVPLDTAHSAQQVADLLANETVLTVHSEEATLADIFVQVTGRGLQS